MGAIVRGLLIHTKPTDSGRFARQKKANAAASSICNGVGSIQQKTPTAQPLATLERLKPHSWVSCTKRVAQRKVSYFWSRSGFGLICLKNLRGIV